MLMLGMLQGTDGSLRGDSLIKVLEIDTLLREQAERLDNVFTQRAIDMAAQSPDIDSLEDLERLINAQWWIFAKSN